MYINKLKRENIVRDRKRNIQVQLTALLQLYKSTIQLAELNCPTKYI